MISISELYLETFVKNLSGREHIQRNRYKQSHKHKYFTDSHSNCLDISDDQRVYGSLFDMFDKKKIATHSHYEVNNDLTYMYSEKYFI